MEVIPRSPERRGVFFSLLRWGWLTAAAANVGEEFEVGCAAGFGDRRTRGWILVEVEYVGTRRIGALEDATASTVVAELDFLRRAREVDDRAYGGILVHIQHLLVV